MTRSTVVSMASSRVHACRCSGPRRCAGSPDTAPVSALTADREKPPVVGYALQVAPTRFASPKPAHASR